MTGLGCQEGGFSHGIGTPYPFRFLRHSGKSAAQVKQALERRRIPGMSYRVIQTKTKSGYSVEGVYVRVNNWSQCRPTALSFHMMQLTAEWSASNPFASPKNESLFNKHVGSTAWWNEISIRGKNARVNEFLKRWASTSKSFISYSQQFWLYQ